MGGFEIYLDDFSLGSDLWDTVWAAGEGLSLSPGSPNLIERVEGRLLSYGNDMIREDNPLECGLGRFCRLDGEVRFIGLQALQEIAEQGPQRRIRGVIFDGGDCPPCQHPWPVIVNDQKVGQVTTATWSPRFENNVALAMIKKGSWNTGTRVAVESSDGIIRQGQVVDTPMKGSA